MIDIKNYYENKDFYILENELDAITIGIKNSGNKKEIQDFDSKLYSFYLQLIEIFLINSFAMLENNLWNNIFLSNSELRRKVKNTFYEKGKQGFNEECAKKFLNYFRINKLSNNAIILKEIIEEYLNHFQFLNAFKHGLRIEGKGESTLSVQDKKDGNKWNLILECDSSVRYLGHEKVDKNQRDIFDFQIWFNKDRIFIKCRYLIGLLKRARGELFKNRDYSLVISDEDIEKMKKENQSLKMKSQVGKLKKGK